MSAKHLSQVKRYRSGGQVKSDGEVVPSPTPKTAIHYHNKCIAHLISLSGDQLEARIQDLLAAAIILRSYSEVDAPSIAEDIESAVRRIQIFLDPQAMSAASDYGLRLAAFWIALRREALTAFSKQRAFCNKTPTTALTQPPRMTASATVGIDGTYVDRLSRYKEVEAFDDLWIEHGPPFVYAFLCAPEALRPVEIKFKNILKRLCGIALSNLRVAPALVTASMAITMCGDMVTKREK
ncbi:uncharacterized protein BDW43DRAFT_304792 [Aspergillus alliaceus]|uniref:uncharacterized protein n=1 Tax=Petromyces alliaceus TaxID=209559 RepID=UPI0012A76DC5|nr:uncharacterized protein BDW43DRAFT_304792 [Aspergillus alliaceus]KAB8227182.1 hypothetical protein BDW43DRAFT_304792 [Aspergillus alliaceus]